MKISENVRTSDIICWKHFGKTNCYILQFSCLKQGFHGILDINPDNTNYDKNSYKLFFYIFPYLNEDRQVSDNGRLIEDTIC